MNTEKSSSPTTESASPSPPIYMMYPPEQGRGVDLTALCKLIWQKWRLIAIVTLIFAAAGAAFSVMATPVYRAECVLAPNMSQQGANLPASLGGLASIAGINLGMSGDATDAVATLRSRVFVEEFIRENDLMPVLYADEWDRANERWIGDDPEEWPDIRDGVTYFTEEIRTIKDDAATGLITFGIEWSDPELAQSWAELLVRKINETLRSRDLLNSERRVEYLNAQLENASLVELRQAVSRLIETEIQTMMIANSEAEYAFKLIDPPRVPKERIFPKAIPIVFFATLLGALIGMSLAIASGWAGISRDEVEAYGNS